MIGQVPPLCVSPHRPELPLALAQIIIPRIVCSQWRAMARPAFEAAETKQRNGIASDKGLCIGRAPKEITRQWQVNVSDRTQHMHGTAGEQKRKRRSASAYEVRKAVFRRMSELCLSNSDSTLEKTR